MGHWSASVHSLEQHTVSPSVCAQFESFAQIAPSGCVPDAPIPPVLVDPPVLVEPPLVIEPPLLVEPPVLVEPPLLVEPPTLIDPPVLVEPPELFDPPLLGVESESSELHPTELETATRTDHGAAALKNARPNAAAA